MTAARSILVRGTVQGVGFRPFVFRMAQANQLAGWVLNAGQGVDIFVEGTAGALAGFVRDLKSQTPPAARITEIEVRAAKPAGLTAFAIRESETGGRPTVQISPDLPVCESCLREMSDSHDRRFRYPYINCTHCGPRYSILNALPYDRAATTMQPWPMDPYCAGQFRNPVDRRFHAQPVACPACGPHYYFQIGAEIVSGDDASIRRAAELLKAGGVVAVKGLGGYHLACDAANPAAVRQLRERKFRREKPFALMARTAAVAGRVLELSPQAAELLASSARPIVVGPARMVLDGVAPDNSDLGVMLPYTPLHYLLFDGGAPELLVMTSANRSNEPIVYRDEDAVAQLSGIADAFLIGERAIARPVDDSIVRSGAFGPTVLRRGRGYAPGPVAHLPTARPILAVGGDLKNTVTVVVQGQAFMSQHIGDLEHYGSFETFRRCIADLLSMYRVPWPELLLAHDLHPGYFATGHALALPAGEHRAIQHHRAHISSVLAEHAAWERTVVGIAFDGTGYGDDGAIWGGELFTGSIRHGLDRAAHLRYASLPGGDAAARNPLQAAAGFFAQLQSAGAAKLFGEHARYRDAARLVESGTRTFQSSSMGRLFDSAAAALGFTRPVGFEGQAAMWLEHQARSAVTGDSYPFPLDQRTLDFRPLLAAVLEDRVRGRDVREIARAFHRGIAKGVCDAALRLCGEAATDTVVLSGGVFQNDLLLHDLKSFFEEKGVRILTNRMVPANDGGLSLGQAALAVFGGN